MIRPIETLLILAIIIAFSNCTFENRKTTTQIRFEDLDRHIQDTLRNLPVDTFGCYPDLIDLTGHYKLTTKEIGPWCYAQLLKDLETGKSYWFYYNTPRPFIVTSYEIIFPADYNIITMGIARTDTFNIVNIN